jgi:Cys-rich protein (TIGR01571 family)
MKSLQEPRNLAATFIYPNKLELGEGVDHNGITVGEWNSGFFNCCDDIIPNGNNYYACSEALPSSSNVYSLRRVDGVPLPRGFRSSDRGSPRTREQLLGHSRPSRGSVYIVAGLAAFAEGDPLLLLLCVMAEFISTASIACLRVKMRDLFSIPGNILQDATLVVLCRPCAVAQMATHIAAYRAGKCMITARGTLPGYHS